MRGGKRNGAGRKKGSISKTTAIGKEAIIKAAAEGITPLDFLLGTMRNEETDFHTRLDAAKAAAPYMHPRLASVEHSGDEESPLVVRNKIEVVVVDPGNDPQD
jgi:hypothetical protein